MKYNGLNLLLFFACFLMVSCASNETSDSDKVAQSEIYQSYFVEYDASTKEFEATAGFRFGGENGTTLRLVNKSVVRYEGQEMRIIQSPWTGTSYSYAKKGVLKAEHRFEYLNNEGETFVNSVPLLQAEPILVDAKIYKSKGVVVSWAGMPLSSKDQVELVLQDSNQSYSYYPKLLGTTSIKLSAAELAPLTTGSGQISIRRSVTLSLQKGKPIGGVIGSEYQSKALHCEFVN